MLPCTLAPVRRLRSSLAQANTLLQGVRLGVQKALADEGRGLLQKPEHFIEQFQHEYHLLHSKRTDSRAKDEIVSINSACSAAIVPGSRKQPPPLNLERRLEL